MKRMGLGLLIAGVLIGALAGPGLAAGRQVFPSFWPAARPPQSGFDFWRVWVTRCAVRQTPTSPFNIGQRQLVMRVWLDDLRARKLPVDDVASRQRLGQIGHLLDSGDMAGACAEVDAIFRGLEALAADKEYAKGAGPIVGMVVDESGAPAAGVDVLLLGTPPGAITNADGRFTITNVPSASPRYILQARKQGYLDGFTGGLSAQPGREAEAILLIEKLTPDNSYRAESLAVKIGRIVEIRQTGDPAQPLESAFMDVKNYPEEVRPYLKPAVNLDSDNPTVRAQAQSILASVGETDRLRTAAVAKAVYGWVVRNIEFDLLRNFPDDPTSGNWQVTFGAWGRNYDEWCYKPSEVLAQKRANAIEFERLATALLRALSIPARPAFVGSRPVCQWWVQMPTGTGYWANMETSIGRLEFKRTGNLDARFPAVGDDRIAFYGVDERAPIYVTTDAARSGLWLEDPGEVKLAPRSDDGLRGSRDWLGTFAAQGRLPKAGTVDDLASLQRGQLCYEVATRGLVINLASLGAQKKLTVRFPMYVTNQYRATLEAKHWTNHPEWVKATRREKEQNETTKQSQEWYVVDFEMSAAPPAAAPPAAKPAETKPAETKPTGKHKPK